MVYICIDNFNTAKKAGSVPIGSSQVAFIKIKRKSKKLASKREKGVILIRSIPYKNRGIRKYRTTGKKTSSSAIHTNNKGNRNSYLSM